ncbi:MAG TPA: RDD family protein [Polyangia bacterium]|nr:RDD family protein [Polyangia bacterium]
MIVATNRRAGFVSRLSAFILDAIVLTLVLRGSIWFMTTSAKGVRVFSHPVNFAALTAATLPLLVGAYFVSFWRMFGQTPGKWMMGLKIVATDGGTLKSGRSLLRFIGYWISGIPFYAGFAWILGPERRAWHDRLARTEVVYVARTPELSTPAEVAPLQIAARAARPPATRS